MSHYGLENHGIVGAGKVHWNLPVAPLVEESIRRGEGRLTSAGALTSKGKALFEQISESWSGYVAQNPPKPSLEVAKEMVRIYDEEGLDKPASAVEVLQLIVASEPNNAAYYASLAEYAYKAKNTRVGDLAGASRIRRCRVSGRSPPSTGASS